MTRVVRRNVGTNLSLSCDVNAVPAATFVEIRRRNVSTGEQLVLNSTGMDIQSVRYTLSNLMLSDSSDVFFCAANNSVGLRERNFTLVVRGGWTLIGTHILHVRFWLGRKPCNQY